MVFVILPYKQNKCEITEIIEIYFMESIMNGFFEFSFESMSNLLHISKYLFVE